MNKYFDDMMYANSKIYESIMKKAVDGQTITDNELIFIMQHQKNIKLSMAVSPLDKILNSAKQIFQNQEITDEVENNEL